MRTLEKMPGHKLNDDYHNWINTFIELSGDRVLSTYKKADARNFKELLLRLPKNRDKMPATKGLSLTQAADKADAMDMERLSPSTINRASICSTIWPHSLTFSGKVADPFK